MSVYKPQKSRFWQYDFQQNGRRFHGSTGVENRRLAEEVERRKRRAAALGELDVDDIPSLHQAASTWWTNHGQHLRAAEAVWRRIGINLRIFGKNTKVTDLDQGVVTRGIQKRRNETFTRAPRKTVKGKRVEPRRYPIAPATVNADIVGVLRRILNDVRTDDRIAKIMPEINWKKLHLAEPEAEFRLYSRDEREAWLGECDEVARFFLRLLLTYGPRFSELYFHPAAFMPADLEDVRSAHLAIDKRKRGFLLLPLRDDDAGQIAARVGRAMAADLGSIWFEQAPDGTLVEIPKGGMIARLRSAARRAGLRKPRLIHGARHHAGTMVLHRTQNQRMPQQLLGHADPRSSTRYAHVLTKDLKAALEQESRNSPEAAVGAGEFIVPKQRRRGARSRLS